MVMQQDPDADTGYAFEVTRPILRQAKGPLHFNRASCRCVHIDLSELVKVKVEVEKVVFILLSIFYECISDTTIVNYLL